MPVKHLISPGVGFSPASVKFIVTRGLSIGVVVDISMPDNAHFVSFRDKRASAKFRDKRDFVVDRDKRKVVDP